jgi:hypothetical protein
MVHTINTFAKIQEFRLDHMELAGALLRIHCTKMDTGKYSNTPNSEYYGSNTYADVVRCAVFNSPISESIAM